jgi:hypothetical protein
MEAVARQTIDLTEDDEQTLTSGMADQIGWNDDPLDEDGILHIEFNGGDRYLYLGVPRTVAIELLHRATNPDHYDESLEQYFHDHIRTTYDYKRID